MFIQTQSTPNPNSMKFLPGQPLITDGNFMDFPSAQSAKQSPLAKALFKIEGVTGVFVGADYVALNVADGSDWLEVKPQAFSAITEFLTSGQPLIAEGTQVVSQNAIKDTDSEVVAAIKTIIDDRIRETVQADGGDVLFREFDEATGTVYLQMQGSCVGCPSSSATLKSGIEKMLMHYIPEVKAVDEWKDPLAAERNAVSEQQLAKLEQNLEAATKGESFTTNPAHAHLSVNEKIAQIFAKFDVDKDQYLNFQEVSNLMRNTQEGVTRYPTNDEYVATCALLKADPKLGLSLDDLTLSYGEAGLGDPHADFAKLFP